MKIPLHVLGEHNDTNTKLYFVHLVKHQSVLKKYMQKAGEPENDVGFHKHIEGLAPVYFALIIIIVVHVVTSISINKYMQKAGEPENGAGFVPQAYI